MEFCIVITGAGGGIGKALIWELVHGLRDNNLLFYPNYRVKERKKITAVKIIAISRQNNEISKICEEINTRDKGLAVSIKWLPAHFENEQGFSETLNKLRQMEGPVHALINNAAEFAQTPLQGIDPKIFEKIYFVNVTVPALLIKELEGKLAMDTGHIINIGSMGGIQGAVKFPGFSVYSSSKMALAGITECLATELPRNVFINYLGLGSVNTGMLKEAFPDFVSDVEPGQMASYIINFLLNAPGIQNGKLVEVSLRNP